MPQPSIHYRRRYHYAAWIVLLLLSGCALFLWERPARVDLASLQVRIQVPDAPPGTRVQAWAGPWRAWQGRAWTGSDAFADTVLDAGGAASLALVRLPIARRRWVQGYIPRGTSDLVMLRLNPPSGPPRFFALPCSLDIRTGLLRPRRRLAVEINDLWNNLSIDPSCPNRVP